MGLSTGPLRFSRRGEAIETVRLDRMALHLLAAGEGVEVIRHVMEPKARWALRPAEGWHALECFVVESGKLRWFRPDGDVLLGPGDCVAAHPVTEECLFRAETELSLLYITSEPVFAQYSQESRQMMELAVTVEQKDGYTAGHCRRIMTRSMAVGRRLGLPPGRLWALHYGAFLHDLGKVSIPDDVLRKPGPLTLDEWQIIYRHPLVGSDMVERTVLRQAAPIIAQHHERLDGSGYPNALRGDAILLEAQIVAVVDAYDAMTSDRPYRKAKPADAAMQELCALSGTHYRPDVVQAFLATLAEEPGRGQPAPPEEG
ncbi:MAG: HD-GYP domain-containing protein [Bacillota bacterium]